ncbi:MAG: type II secretion system protein [Phycisphaerales bacterium]
MRHNSMTQRGAGNNGTSGRSRGFTLIEMIMSVLVIGILMALVITGAVQVTRLAKDTVNAQAVRSIAAAISQFKTECGIVPPLVKDAQPSNNTTVVVRGTPPKTYVNVFNLSDQYDTASGSAADVAVLRTKSMPNPSSNPFGQDRRYSEQSLAIYLMGAMNALDLDNVLPLDGVVGNGMYKALPNGRFEVPDSVIKSAQDPANNPSRSTGKVLGPYLEASTGKVVIKDSADEHTVQLVDAKNVPYRYYRWVQGVPDPNSSSNPPKYIVRTTADMNIPRLVGIDTTAGDYILSYKWYRVPPERDISKNPALKSATWAVVGAGRNGAFGDETDLMELGRLLGHEVTAANERESRVEAAADNIVEVGQ